MKKQEKSLTKSFRWTSWIKADKAFNVDQNSWTTWGGNFNGRTYTDSFPDPKEVAYNHIGNRNEYNLLKNLRKSEPNGNKDFLGLDSLVDDGTTYMNYTYYK